MTLLFDENLSPVLPVARADCYAESQHFRDAGLKASTDAHVWEYAARNALVIATKDSDFRQRSFSTAILPK